MADGQELDPAPDPAPGSRIRGLAARARRAAIVLPLCAGIAIFAKVVHGHYPIHQWLFWRYFAYLALTAIWSVACLCLGHVTIVRLLRRPLPIVEHVAISFAAGMFGFFMAITAGGLLRLYGAAFFALLPLSMIAIGGRSALRYVRRLRRGLERWRSRAAPTPLWVYAIFAFGFIGVLMVYFSILTPENAQFDARWKHLALAEDYAAYGGVRRFPEGWTVATYPHLATMIYTWAFLFPRGALFDFVELAAHMEFAGLLFTLAAIPALVRRLLPRREPSTRVAEGDGRAPGRALPRLAATWPVMFLFPGIFLYDSSLSSGGDHIAAVFAIPLFLMLLRAYERLSPRLLVLMAMMMAGAGLVKYTGILLLWPVPAAAVAVRAITFAIQAARGKADTELKRNAYLGPLAALAGGLFFTAPHWAKNLAYYGDPLYPLLYKRLHLHPWTEDAASIYVHAYSGQFWRPERTLAGFLETLKALATFSFVPNDYSKFHGSVPVFGSLFTLLLLCLPLLGLKKLARLWALALYVHVALFAWYWTHHQDRYLQAILPLMAAATGALIVLVGRTNWVNRVAVAGLVALQAIWGGDVYFIPGHVMARGSPAKMVMDLLSSGYRKEFGKRLEAFGEMYAVRKALPAGAHLLLHDNHNHLGIGVTSVNDCKGWQFGLSYGELESPKAVQQALAGMGVTHVLWSGSNGWDSVAGDVMFYNFVTRYTVDKKTVGRSSLARMPEAPPEVPFNDAVAYLGCGKAFKNGLYTVADLRVPTFGPTGTKYPAPRRAGPPAGEAAEALVADAGTVVLETKCVASIPGPQKGSFVLGGRREVVRGVKNVKPQEKIEIWVRSAAGAPGDAAPARPASADDDDPALGETP